VSRLIRQALDALNAKIAEGFEYHDAHTFVVTTLGLSDEQAGEFAQAYDSQDEKRGAA
jgi:hypothetical protein